MSSLRDDGRGSWGAGQLRWCLGKGGRRAQSSNRRVHGADARLAQFLHSSTSFCTPGRLHQPLISAQDIPAEQIWKRGGGEEGKQQEASSSQLLHPCQDSGAKGGERNRFCWQRKGKEGRAGAAFVLQVPSLQCQAGPRSRLVTWLQSVSPRNPGCRAGCPSKGTLSEMSTWAKRYDPQPSFGDTTL